MEIYKFLGKEFKCPYCGKIHKIGVKKIESGNIDCLPDFISKIIGKNKKILILADNITYRVAGEKIENILGKIWHVKSIILNPEGEKRVTAQEKYLSKIEGKIEDEKIIITVGTGTITDLGKIAAARFNIPVICFPTAASMNAYTSPVAAYIKNGMKLTIPVKSAEAIFMDFEIIKDAPVDLTKAGFADSLSKGYANADWKISSMITGENFCFLPFEIMSKAEKKYVDKGKNILKKDGEIIGYLMEGLNIGGISMSIAGKSSPVSGAEHLISHFLDMYAHLNGKENFSWHGLQVGIGILFSSFVYEHLQNLNKKDMEMMFRATKIDYESKIENIEKNFLKGKPILKKEFEKKIKSLELLRERFPSLWDGIKDEVRKFIHPYSEIRNFLKNAECPLSFKEIGVSEELGYNSILSARYIRDRLTILDIADELGIIEKIASEFMEE